MKTVVTTFPHDRDAQGKRLDAPCDGVMELRALPGAPVEVACSKCSHGWSVDWTKTGVTNEDVIAMDGVQQDAPGT